MTVDGAVLRVRHPRFDIGGLDDIFDGDLETMARTLDANPARLEIRFAEPKLVAGVRFNLWDGPYQITMRAVGDQESTTETSGYFEISIPPPTRDLFFAEPVPSVVVLEIGISKPGDGHVHFRGVEILE